MLFKRSLIKQIIAGRKTQTRRPIKPGETFDADAECVRTASGKIKIACGRDYAVQDGRGRSGLWWQPDMNLLLPAPTDGESGFAEFAGCIPLRIRVIDIRQEDVRQISRADAIDEGFPDERWFWATWCGFYDAQRFIAESIVVQRSTAVMQEFLHNRPDDKYQAWAYTFRVEV